MKTTTASSARPAHLLVTVLAATLTLGAPVASAAVSLVPNANNPDECVLMSGVWGSGLAPYEGEVGAHSEDLLNAVVVSGAVVMTEIDLLSSDNGITVLFFWNGEVLGNLVGSFADGNDYRIVAEKLPGDGEFVSWFGTYEIRKSDCERNHGVPEDGGSAVLLLGGLVATSGARRLITKRRRA